MPVPASRGALAPPTPADGAPPLPAFLPPAPIVVAPPAPALALPPAPVLPPALLSVVAGVPATHPKSALQITAALNGKSLGISSSLRMTGSRAGRGGTPRELAEHKA